MNDPRQALGRQPRLAAGPRKSAAGAAGGNTGIATCPLTGGGPAEHTQNAQNPRSAKKIPSIRR